MGKLRNNGIITKANYIGKTIDEAKKYASDGGFESRVVQENGKSFMLDMDARGDRLNFIIINDIVTDVYGG